MGAPTVRVESSALDVQGDVLVLRGVLDSTTLNNLLVDTYQREVLPITSLASLIRACEHGDPIPDIELGMRGDSMIERATEGLWILRDPVYIVDGLQRVSAARVAMQRGTLSSRLGATIYMNTNEAWERDRFRILNAARMKLAPSILLRNLRSNVPAVEVLYSMTTGEPAFVMNDRVCWSQRMRRGDLISGLTFGITVGNLHAHAGPGLYKQVDDLAGGLDKIMENVGMSVFRANIRTYFDLVDECWGIRSVAFKESSNHLRSNFLIVVATLLSRHLDFWRDDGRLVVEADLRRKIASFPTTDPTIAGLASSGGKAKELLYLMLKQHVNSGKRTRKLRLRSGVEEESAMLDMDEHAVAE